MEKLFAEVHNVKQAFVPQDAAAGLTGARVSLASAYKLAVVVSMGDSVAAGAVEFALKQHDAAAAGNSKALSIDNPYFKKVENATSFTKVAPTVAADTYALTSDFASKQGMVIFEILAEDLDVNNGFAWISVDVAATTAAKIVNVEYILHSCKTCPAYDIAL